MDGGENGEEDEEDIEENNEGTAPDEGAQVIVDLRKNRGAAAYNGAVRTHTSIIYARLFRTTRSQVIMDRGWSQASKVSRCRTRK